MKMARTMLYFTLAALTFGTEAHAQRTFVAASYQYAQRAYTDASVQTWSAWIRLPSTNVIHPIICTMRGWDTSNHYRLLFYSPGSFLASERAGGTAASSVSNVLPAINTWIHVAARFTGTNSRTLWVNGNACATETTGVEPTAIDEAYLARARTSISMYYSGASIAEAAIWHDALTDSEIAQLAADGAFSRRTHPSKIRPGRLVWLPDLTIPGAAVPGVGGVTEINNAPALLTVLPPPFK